VTHLFWIPDWRSAMLLRRECNRRSGPALQMYRQVQAEVRFLNEGLNRGLIAIPGAAFRAMGTKPDTGFSVRVARVNMRPC
jgi:hypothetical protein